MRRRGLSLHELIMALALLSLLLSVTLACITSYSRAFRQLTDRHPNSASLARGLGECVRSLREADIVEPSAEALAAGFSPTREQPLRLSGGQALFYDERRRLVVRKFEGHETIIGEAAGFRVQSTLLGRRRLLSMQLEDAGGRPPVQTCLTLEAAR